MRAGAGSPPPLGPGLPTRLSIVAGMSSSTQLRPGVHRLGTEFLNWYVLETDDGLVVVDCGVAGYHDQLLELLDDLGREPSDIAAIVITHYHSDHVGSAERIREQSGATVYVSETDADGVRGGKVPPPKGLRSVIWRPRMLRMFGHFLRNGGASFEKVSEVTTFTDGEELPVAGLRVIATPGHTLGHCSILSPGHRTLFSGDALLTVHLGTGEPGPQLPPVGEDLDQLARSARRLEALDADLVLPGHGEPFEGSPADAVAEALA